MKISLFLGVFLFFASVSLPKISAQPSGSGQPLSDTIRLVPLKIREGKTLRSSALNDFKLPSGALLLSPDFSQLARLTEPSAARHFSFDLPISVTRTLPIVLEEVSVLGQSFTVTTSSGKSVALPALRFYRGKVVGDESSTVSPTSTVDGLQGLVYGNGFSYTLNKIGGNNPARLHAVYATEEQAGELNFQCGTRGILMSDTVAISPQKAAENPGGRTSINDCRKVGVYFEADYMLYQQLGANLESATT